jgi:hypothetical protein
MYTSRRTKNDECWSAKTFGIRRVPSDCRQPITGGRFFFGAVIIARCFCIQ